MFYFRIIIYLHFESKILQSFDKSIFDANANLSKSMTILENTCSN